MNKIIVLYADINEIRVDEATICFDRLVDILKPHLDHVPIIMLPKATSLTFCGRDEIIAWRDLADNFIKRIDGTDKDEAETHKLPVANQKRGQWMQPRYGNYTFCSECGHIFHNEDSWYYCPHCGSDMRQKWMIKEEGEQDE